MSEVINEVIFESKGKGFIIVEFESNCCECGGVPLQRIFTEEELAKAGYVKATEFAEKVLKIMQDYNCTPIKEGLQPALSTRVRQLTDNE